MASVLNNEDYQKIIQNYLKTSTDTKNIQIISTEWSSLSENIEGFMGQHYHLKITYKLTDKEESAQFFIKTKPTQSEIQKDISTKINVYEKETFLYDHLFREYEKYGITNEFSPKCYYCKNTETIVMEDLSKQGYRLRLRKEFYDLDACKTALRALASFHASAMVYEEIKSKELGRDYRIGEEFPEVFNEPFYAPGDKGIGYQFVEVTKDCLLKLSERLDESEEWKRSFQERLKKFDSTSLFCRKIPGRKSCGHGDLWCNNMLFMEVNNIPIECRLIDYQVLRYYQPGFDVVLLIYTNTLNEFRCEHLENLIMYYYEQFSELLKSHGVEVGDILSKEDFLESCKLLEGIAVFQAIGGKSLTHLPLEITNDAVASKKVDLQDIWFKNRAKYVLEGCERDETYRKLMISDVYDINKFI